MRGKPFSSKNKTKKPTIRPLRGGAIALETSGTQLSFCVRTAQGTVKNFRTQAAWDHEVILWRRLPQEVRKTGFDFKQTRFLATTRGPGRFTGVRLGLAPARVWSSLLQVPIFAPAVYELMAWQRLRSLAILRPQSSSLLPRLSTSLLCIVAYSGAFVGALFDCALHWTSKSFPGPESLFNYFSGKRVSNLLYYAAPNQAKDIPSLAAKHKFDSCLEIIPDAEALLQWALNAPPEDPRWHPPNKPPQPLYLKDTWKPK